MAALPTISETIDIADLSLGYCANYNSDGALYGARLAPRSPVTIAIVTDALRWANDGGAESVTDLREIANYLIWLIGRFGMEAKATISGGGGGGSVVPATGANIYPFIITSANFESDGVSYNDSRIIGDNLSLFIDEYNQQWLTAPTYFVYTATGFRIIADGFNANDNNYTIMVQKLRS